MAPDLKFLGTTTRGTQVCVNPLAVGRKVILIGGTIHHLMAGYGGGRKSILPCISGKSTINQNHIHSLSPMMPRSNPLIGMGLRGLSKVYQPVSGSQVPHQRYLARLSVWPVCYCLRQCRMYRASEITCRGSVHQKQRCPDMHCRYYHSRLLHFDGHRLYHH
jgi:hypothetical protein